MVHLDRLRNLSIYLDFRQIYWIKSPILFWERTAYSLKMHEYAIYRVADGRKFPTQASFYTSDSKANSLADLVCREKRIDASSTAERLSTNLP